MGLVNLGAHDGLATAIAMLPYVYFDLFALADTAHWTPSQRASLCSTARWACSGWWRTSGSPRPRRLDGARVGWPWITRGDGMIPAVELTEHAGGVLDGGV